MNSSSLLMEVRFGDKEQKGKRRQMQGMKVGGRNFGSGVCLNKQQGASLRRSRRLPAGLESWRQLMRAWVLPDNSIVVLTLMKTH